MLSIKFITHSSNTSFHRLTKLWIEYFNNQDGIVATSSDIKTDVTVLHPAIDILVNLRKVDKQKDGLIVCVDVSDTDRVSQKYSSVINSNCDVVITHSEWSKKGMINGGVNVPIEVISHGIEYKKVRHERGVGFYLSFLPEQIYRKGTDLAINVLNRLKDLNIIVKQYQTNYPLKWKTIGWVNDIYEEYYSKFSLFVHLPRGGAQELEVYEALASGCNVIVPDHPLFEGLPVIRAKSHYIPKIILPYWLQEYHIGGGYEADVDDVVDKIYKSIDLPPPDYKPKTMEEFVKEFISVTNEYLQK